MRVGIIGVGFVGGAMVDSFKRKKIDTILYDKYKDVGAKHLCETFDTEILFLALPTKYDEKKKEYNKVAINQVLSELDKNNYNGIIAIKSTVEPQTTMKLAGKFNLNLVHNPEFLSAKTALYDFHNQKNIIIGRTENVDEKKLNNLVNFYKKYYPKGVIRMCNSTESELMKITENSYSSTKIQFFTEIYLLCEKLDISYDNVCKLLLSNERINKCHTRVPGPDGEISYGGYCFPKDTNALYEFMKKNNSPSDVLASVIQERNAMRSDNDNIIRK